MDVSEGMPRFRAGWAVPTAFFAAVAVATLATLAEIVGLAVFLGGGDPVAVARTLPDWLVAPLTVVVLTAVTVFGLPTWMLMHLLGAVHPGQGALVGGMMGGVAAGVGLLLLLPNPQGLVLALFGVLPGAAGGAICLWVAYRP